MNPIKFLIEDFKSDMVAVKEIVDVISGKKKTPDYVKERFRRNFLHGWGDFFKNNWLFFLLLGLAFASGWFMAGKHYQNICNLYIWETYIEPQMLKPVGSVAAKIGNWTMSNITFN